MPRVHTLTLSPEDQIRLWMFRNRGLLAKISRDLKLSRTFVSTVLYGREGGKSKGLRVERRLAAAGAPFMADRIARLIERKSA